jgi:hypothetical protein
MYPGGPGSADSMIDAYRAAGPLTAAQIAYGLPVMLRFRWAVQADYFARRITENDLTGLAGPEENEKGWRTPAVLFALVYLDTQRQRERAAGAGRPFPRR